MLFKKINGSNKYVGIETAKLMSYYFTFSQFRLGLYGRIPRQPFPSTAAEEDDDDQRRSSCLQCGFNRTLEALADQR